MPRSRSRSRSRSRERYGKRRHPTSRGQYYKNSTEGFYQTEHWPPFILIGDSRVQSLVQICRTSPPHRWMPDAKTPEILEMVEEELKERGDHFEIVVIFALQNDMLRLKKQKVTGERALSANQYFSSEKVLLSLQHFFAKMKSKYPHIVFILTLPYFFNFTAYNRARGMKVHFSAYTTYEQIQLALRQNISSMHRQFQYLDLQRSYEIAQFLDQKEDPTLDGLHPTPALAKRMMQGIYNSLLYAKKQHNQLLGEDFGGFKLKDNSSKRRRDRDLSSSRSHSRSRSRSRERSWSKSLSHSKDRSKSKSSCYLYYRRSPSPKNKLLHRGRGLKVEVDEYSPSPPGPSSSAQDERERKMSSSTARDAYPEDESYSSDGDARKGGRKSFSSFAKSHNDLDESQRHARMGYHKAPPPNADGFTIKGTLLLLEKLQDELKLFAPSIEAFVKECRDKGSDSTQALSAIQTSDAKLLLKMVMDTLASEHDLDSSQTDPALTKAYSWTQKLLNFSKKRMDSLSFLDLKAIARGTNGKDSTFTLDFIKVAFGYEGIPSAPKELLNEAYLKVCSMRAEQS